MRLFFDNINIYFFLFSEVITDPHLTFPVIDCNEELDIYSESNTSGIANLWANGDEDDNLSDLLSASQIGTIGTMVGESDLQLFSEASCAHSVRLSMATSHLSDYFSEEDGNKSSESLIFTCEEHSQQNSKTIRLTFIQ